MKYCRPGSEFEINISSMDRNRLTNLMSDKDNFMDSNVINLVDLFNLFDASRQEMLWLLSGTHKRFRFDTKGYSNIIEILEIALA